MSKLGKKPTISPTGKTAPEQHRRNCSPNVARIPYKAHSIRESNSYGPRSQKYDPYIEQFEESSDDSDVTPRSDRPKEYIQENKAISKKYELETIHEKVPTIHQKVPSKPIIHCYNASRHDVNSPLIAKKSAPIKKISFVLPDGQKPLDEDHMDWKDYHRLEVIYKFMDELETDFPSICTTASIGKSVEGRHLKILKISNSVASNVAVWMDAGIHAREWIAPAVNTYIANHISRNFDSLPDSVTNKDWYFLPVVNPDGYHYSHTTDRLWRKSRAFHNGVRTGVDLNRNFGVGWGGRGSSDKPTHAFYRGPHPFSEPETSAMRDVFLQSGINFKVYITLHSYGQIIIFPYSCTTAMAPDYMQLLEGATAMSKAIFKTNGETYKVGISRDVMYPSAGTSSDFAHGAAGIPYCYLIELRSKTHKFKLPKEEIEDTGKEILNSVLALMEFVDIYKYQTHIDQKNIDQKNIEHKNIDQNIAFQMKKYESIKDSCAFMKTNDSYMKKCKSYDKTDYSFTKKRNSHNEGSYVRLSRFPVEKDDVVPDDTSDTDWPDLYENINVSYSVPHSPIVMHSNTSEKATDPYNKHKENFKNPSDISMGKIKLVHYDSFSKKKETFTNANTSDFSMNQTDSMTHKENSLEVESSYHEHVHLLSFSRHK